MSNVGYGVGKTLRVNSRTGLDMSYKSGGLNWKMLNESLRKTFRRIESINPKILYTLKLTKPDGTQCQINALPWLVNCSGWFSDNSREMIMREITAMGMIRKDIFLEDLKDPYEMFSFDYLACLLHSPMDIGIRELAGYLYIKDKKRFSRAMFNGVEKILEGMLQDGGRTVLDLGDIPNSQGASYLISILWLVQTEPMLLRMLFKQLKGFNLTETLWKCVPEGSNLRKLMLGEMTPDEYYEAWTNEDDKMVSDAIREYVAVASNGDYKGGELPQSQVGQALDYLKPTTGTGTMEFILSSRLAGLMFSAGFYDQVATEKEKDEAKIAELQEKVAELRKDAGNKNLALNEARKELDKEKKRADKAEHDLASMKTDEQLKEELDECKGIISDRETLLDTISNKNAVLTQTISKLKRKVELLNSRLDAFAELTEQNIEDIEEEIKLDEEIAQKPIEDVVAFLREKCIYIVGGDKHFAMDKKLAQYGLENVRQFRISQKSIGACDIAVCLTRYCEHATWYHCIAIAPDDCVCTYYNGSNVETLLYTIYEELNCM